MYNNFFPENRAVYEIIWSQAGHRRHYGANALHAKATHTHKHTHANKHTHKHKKHARTHAHVITIVSYGSNGYANAPLCYIIRTFPALLKNGRCRRCLNPAINKSTRKCASFRVIVGFF